MAPHGSAKPGHHTSSDMHEAKPGHHTCLDMPTHHTCLGMHAETQLTGTGKIRFGAVRCDGEQQCVEGLHSSTHPPVHPSTHPSIHPCHQHPTIHKHGGDCCLVSSLRSLSKKTNLMRRRSQAERWLGGANRCCWHHTMLAGPTQLESRPGPWLQKRMPMLHSPTQKMTLYLKIQAARTFLRHGRAPIELKMGLCAVPKA